jgi:acyl-coenzyme A thioesterase PaaI-like protein
MSGPGAEELNEAVRRLVTVLRTSDIDDDEARTLMGQIDAVRTALEPRVVEGDRMQAMLRSDGPPRQPGATELEPGLGGKTPPEFFPYSPVVGALNPLSPPADMWSVKLDPAAQPEVVSVGDYAVHGKVTFPAGYNGPPNAVHGGMLAALFDELLGSVCVVNAQGGFTGTLTIRYRSPAPLDTELTMRAHVVHKERRKTFAGGELFDGSTLLAEAEGIFIRPDMG